MTAAAPRVAVLDYGSGNVHSAVKALVAAGAEVELTRDPRAVQAADGLLVPGVGAFDAVMQQLTAVRGDELIDRRLAGGRPVLGICVGLQVMFARGVERGVETDGLDQWPGTVRELRAPVLPHMGWNTIAPPQDSRLFDGVADERFYFVHSNAATEWTLEGRTEATRPRVTWAEHGERFVAAVENGPLSATQFHPEKSGEAGIQLLRNWITTF
ncbi:imidazole glycerol phosphate synthase subunit HisH [Leucobacter luti]|uniref:Imidazole glycerol phosphate synthase subunit HisH n=1 Tax=Leucobacter luti TaxID=340320 RepID=A0A4Q7TUN5_9MICO|nr:imidazole glycerol phosphate synthase subunit HisH [Leucobacter luti]MBL3698449.1 imidazole glycerol phosphate synthase subunit HisH [Leucobacter luti]RZT64463.1 glutamine amidotransferase [Leucobacter luti]